MAAKDAIAGLGNLRLSRLMCFDIGDGRVCVVDSQGNEVARISSVLAGPPEQCAIRDAQWSLQCKRLAAQLHYESRRSHSTGWKKKCETWVTSLSSREFDKWRERKPKRGRFFSAEVRDTWASAVVMMKFQLKNKGERKLRHRKNPWLCWADTCSKNHNRKELARDGKKQRTNGNGRRAELQMQSVWRRSVACNV
jgi:hypothetical protein